jgi:hypothetical protein
MQLKLGLAQSTVQNIASSIIEDRGDGLLSGINDRMHHGLLSGLKGSALAQS